MLAPGTKLRLAIVPLVCAIGILAMGVLLYERYLAERPTPPRQQPGPAQVVDPVTERVVLVLLDSMREDVANDPEIMPTLARLRAGGASGVHITPPMTLTTMSVITMATGMTPSISWSLKNFDAEPHLDENMISLLADSGRKIALLGDASWSQLFGARADRRLSLADTGIYDGVVDGMSQKDAITMAEAEKTLADPSFDLVVIHLVSSDKAAHRAGAHLYEEDGTLSEYASALNRLDAWVGRMHDRHAAGSWLILSDHGCSKRGNHGGGEPEARRAPFVWAGDGIKPAAKVEAPLNSVAPTLLGLLGVRAPRVAEQPAMKQVMTVSKEAQTRLAYAHFRAREQFVVDTLGAAGLSYKPQGTVSSIETLNSALSSAVGGTRSWFRVIGISIGTVVMALLVGLIAWLVGLPRPWLPALVWAGLVQVLIVFDGWQFVAIQLFGEVPDTPMGLLRAGLGAAGIGGTWFLAREGHRRGIVDGRFPAWLLFCFAMLMLGQSVTRWPFGPLPAMYRTLVVLALTVWVARAAWRSQDGWKRAATGLALTVWLYAATETVLRDRIEARLSDLSITLWADAMAIGLALALAWRLPFGLRLWLAALSAVSLTQVHLPSGTLMWVVLGGAATALVIMSRAELTAVGRRNVAMAVALILYRALAIDERVIILAAIGAAAWALSGVRTSRGPHTAPVAAGLTVLAWLSYFYESGHSFSFSALDVTVAFAATRDAINLGEGFTLMMAQAFGPWLLLTAAMIYNRMISEDGPGAAAAIVAVCAAPVIFAFGAFATFELRLHDHWFTMHAVPLMVFSLCNAGLVGLALLANAPILRRP